MLWFEFNSRAGARVVSSLAISLSALGLHAQNGTAMSASVRDGHGAAIGGATAKGATGPLLGRSDQSGQLTVHCAVPCRSTIEAPGFDPTTTEITAGAVI